MSPFLIVILVLVFIIIGLIIYNLSIYKKIKTFSNINDRISNLNVLQEFLDTIGKDSPVDNKLEIINDILIEKFAIKYSTIVVFNGAEYAIKATNVDEKHWDTMKNLNMLLLMDLMKSLIIKKWKWGEQNLLCFSLCT